MIRRVAIYVLDEHPDERLSELRKIAAEHNWEVTGEYVDRIKPDYQLADKSIEFQPGEAFRALQEADHANRHDAVLSSVGSGGPRLSVNQHDRVSG
ncbi:MAG TPA: hypothetical protein VFV92_08055 [Candidatus Bathyarchaeia archaeon]|nr:hypothetical protein [Candidatus Bathyarchaeia archaeon]